MINPSPPRTSDQDGSQIFFLVEKYHENHVSRQERNIDKTTVQVLIKLSSRQAQFMDIIRENPGLTRRKISERFGIKRGYVNGTIPRLKNTIW